MRKINLLTFSTFLFFIGCQPSIEVEEEEEEEESKASLKVEVEAEVEVKEDNLDNKLTVELPDMGELEYRVEDPRRLSLDSPKDQDVNSDANLPGPSAAVPDFRNVPAGDERRNLFVAFLAPVIEAENAKIDKKRYLIKQIYRGVQNGGKLSEREEQWLKDLAQKYRTKNRDFPSEEAFRDLLLHVDIIPIPLAIAQAANETAWGTSRFARLGNNFFGKWCFTQGCGIVPAGRREGATHEVEVYPTVAKSTNIYMHHVNSHPGYHELREKRYEQRLKNERPDGHDIAVGLKNYSAIGMDYVRILRNMMERIDIETT